MRIYAIAAFATVIGILPPSTDVVPPPLPLWEATIPDLAPGDTGPLVLELQEALAAIGFRPGDMDGEFGGRTYQAVLAFQKYHGLERDGVFRTEHWDLLSRLPVISWRTDANRVEVDLGRQVLFLVVDNEVEAIVPISSGNGGYFTSYDGSTSRARTPEGTFRFYFQRPYNHESYLGWMYKPFYFNGGYAVHGSPSVPPWPASHGCIRVTNPDMDFLRGYFEIGMPVLVYGLATAKPPGDYPSGLGLDAPPPPDPSSNPPVEPD